MSARLGAVLVLVATACGGNGGGGGRSGAESPLPDRVRDLVVVVLDALPASAVGAYGYERETTPHLDALAAGGVRFENAYSAASYTLASVSSMFTGLSPASHGVLGLDTNVLPAPLETVAEAFSRAGFETVCFSSNPHITREGGFAQGFDAFHHFERDRFEYHVVPRALGRGVLEVLREDSDARRLLWVHILPPHQPYDAPPPHADLFGAEETREELGLTAWLVEADGKVAAGSPEARAIRARYDAGVHYADDFLGSLVRELQKSGLSDSTALCIVSDHGEAFGEHGRLLHGTTVFEEMVRVPLVLSWPGIEPTVVRELVSTADLAPTLCELFDVPFPRGTSFLATLASDVPTEPVIARTVGNQPVWSLRTERWTLLEQKGLGRRMLFDRERDREEKNDLLAGDDAEARAIAAQLSRTLAQRLAADRREARAPVESDETHRAAIEGLGYADLETGELGEDPGADD